MSDVLKDAGDLLLRTDGKIQSRMKPLSETPAVKALGKISEIGDQPQLRALSALLVGAGVLTANRRLAMAGARMIVAHELATTLKNVIKRRVDRTRPRSAQSKSERTAKPGKNEAKEETSFPSGHSAGATAAALAFAGEFPEHRAAALAAAGAVSAAQVPRCAHYLTDVGAGLLIGAASGAATNLIFDRLFDGDQDPRDGSSPPPAARVLSVEELRWNEVSLGEIDFPKELLSLAAGFGSGLSTRAGQPSEFVWAICDRGPNIKVADALERYGWRPPPHFEHRRGAKLMPRPDIGPSIALLRIAEGEVQLQKTVRLHCGDGKPVSGLPVPESGHAECEPVLDLDGKHVKPEANGIDTEGLALLADGSFWASEEYGPSLLKISPEGEILKRLVPEGVQLPEAGYPVEPSLPAIAAKRQLNRGFEAVSISPSEKLLYVAFQSPLAHPTEADHKKARHVRIWQLDASGAVLGQFLYPLDEPQTFRRDSELQDVDRSDLKVCEVVATADDELLVLERASQSSKIYCVRVDRRLELGPEHLRVETRPTIEELSAGGHPLPELAKELLFTSDDWPVVGSDIEGMALLDQRTLLIVSDNDFGCEGKQTRFFRIAFRTTVIGE
jgi:membrane-associated phospholipid phosphatase